MFSGAKVPLESPLLGWMSYPSTQPDFSKFPGVMITCGVLRHGLSWKVRLLSSGSPKSGSGFKYRYFPFGQRRIPCEEVFQKNPIFSV